MCDIEHEQEIQAKGLTAPRVTPADITANIVSEHYFTAGNAVCMETSVSKAGRGFFHYHRQYHDCQPPTSLESMTFCVLVLRNGSIVTGESTCPNPENFNAEIGRKIAHENAVNKIWPLTGYTPTQFLHDESEVRKP